MNFFASHSRLKERIRVLEKYVDDLGKAHQAQQIELEKLRDALQANQQIQQEKLRDALQANQQIQQEKLRDAVQAHNDQSHAMSEELKRMRERARIFEDMSLARSLRPAGVDQAIAGLKSPLVSVILPTHNRAATVAEAIASVQAQQMQDWELVIVDDGSIDHTREVVRPFLEDPRIRYIVQDQSGSAGARNRGIMESSAPLIAYLDSDNIWYPEFLQRAVDCLATEPEVDLVYGAMVIPQPEPKPTYVTWRPFVRANLLDRGFIDTNTMVHRRQLVERHGGWSPEITRMQDWDLVLRYTEEKPARRLPVFAVYYRNSETNRITVNHPLGPSLLAIQKKWFPPKELTVRPRVLHVIWQDSPFSEMESEIRCMQRWGVHVEVWREARGTPVNLVDVAVHDGSLSDAIAACHPQVLHGLGLARTKINRLVDRGLPITVRLRDCDVIRGELDVFLKHDAAKAVYAFPNQIPCSERSDPRIKITPAGFDSTRFLPNPNKDRKLVVCAAEKISGNDLPLFFEAARLLPEFRFVLVLATGDEKESAIHELLALCESMRSPAEIRFDSPRDEAARLISDAGIYIHTVQPSETLADSPLGQPVSIAESLATGCFCLVRDLPTLRDFIGGCGDCYSDVGDLVKKIEATRQWSDLEWKNAQRLASDHAFRHHADVVVYREMFRDWAGLINPLRRDPPQSNPCPA